MFAIWQNQYPLLRSASSCNSLPSNPMTTENIEIIRQIYEAFAHQDLEGPVGSG